MGNLWWIPGSVVAAACLFLLGYLCGQQEPVRSRTQRRHRLEVLLAARPFVRMSQR